MQQQSKRRPVMHTKVGSLMQITFSILPLRATDFLKLWYHKYIISLKLFNFFISFHHKTNHQCYWHI